MSTLCIVPCGHRKIWDKKPDAGSTEARYVYTGPFASMCRRYAEKFHPASWMILSAKYGFVPPDFVIEGPYNVTFRLKKTNPISIDELAGQVAELGLSQYGKIVVLGGETYVGTVKSAFRGPVIINPLKGCTGNGVIMGKLKQALQAGVPLEEDQ